MEYDLDEDYHPKKFSKNSNSLEEERLQFAKKSKFLRRNKKKKKSEKIETSKNLVPTESKCPVTRRPKRKIIYLKKGNTRLCYYCLKHNVKSIRHFSIVNKPFTPFIMRLLFDYLDIKSIRNHKLVSKYFYKFGQRSEKLIKLNFYLELSNFYFLTEIFLNICFYQTNLNWLYFEFLEKISLLTLQSITALRPKIGNLSL